MNPDIFCVGFRRGVDIHFAANDKGIAQLPDLIKKSKHPNWTSGMYDVWIAATVPNVIALRLMGIITAGDATNILDGVKT
jgi:hypothetical protein